MSTVFQSCRVMLKFVGLLFAFFSHFDFMAHQDFESSQSLGEALFFMLGF